MTQNNTTQSEQYEELTAALQAQRNLWKEHSFPAYIGLDVHKERIAVSVARCGRQDPEPWGEIANDPSSVRKMIEKLNKKFHGQVLLLCYEAGPCGYVLHRQIRELGHHCLVVAPSLIPKAPGERIKTDRRDAQMLATLLRSGNLTPVWVPDGEQEAMRDLVRFREDCKEQRFRARQRINGYLLRHGHHWPRNKTRWTKTYYKWLESLRFPTAVQQAVLQGYMDMEKQAVEAVNDATAQIEFAMEQWSLAPVVKSLVALRGVDKLAAVTLLAELGDISRFPSPKQLMSFLGLVPGEYSSGQRRRQGRITRAGNASARRMLVECAWAHRFPARKTPHMKRKAKDASEEAKTIAWKAQKRLCGRYNKFLRAGKNTKQANIAVARELVGFIWDVVRIEMGKLLSQAA